MLYEECFSVLLGQHPIENNKGKITLKIWQFWSNSQVGIRTKYAVHTSLKNFQPGITEQSTQSTLQDAIHQVESHLAPMKLAYKHMDKEKSLPTYTPPKLVHKDSFVFFI